VKLLNCPRVHSIFRRSETRMQRQASAIVPRDSGCGTPCVRTTTTEDEEEQEGKAPRRVDSPLWDRLPTERSFDGLEFTPEAETICNAIYSYFRLNLIESDDEEHDVDVESGEFELGQNPNIGLGGFLRRIIKYVNKAHCSNQDNEFLVNESSPGVRALVYSLILIDRLRKKQPTFRLTRQNVFYLITVGALVSEKVCEDCAPNGLISFFSRIAACSVADLNHLEITFLQLLDFHVSVKGDEFDETVKSLQAKAA